MIDNLESIVAHMVVSNKTDKTKKWKKIKRIEETNEKS